MCDEMEKAHFCIPLHSPLLFKLFVLMLVLISQVTTRDYYERKQRAIWQTN